LLRTGPLVGLLWLGAALASRIGAQLAAPWHWASMPIGARLVTHLAAVPFAIAIGGALVTVAATGRLTRWPPRRPRWLGAGSAASAAIAAMAASGTAAIDIALLALLATQAVSTPGRLAALPVAVAAVASLTRLTLTTRAARNCLTTSAACLSSPAGA
jgi:hypothetical protein